MPSKDNISQNKLYFQKQLDKWTNVVSQNLTNLTKPQAVILAMMSLGMIAAQSCALATISAMLAIVSLKKEARGVLDTYVLPVGQRTVFPIKTRWHDFLVWILLRRFLIKFHTKSRSIWW
jgi:hypothetical protein